MKQKTQRFYDQGYIYWLLCSNLLKEFNNYTSNGTTILHLYQNVFERMPMLLPPLSEQQSIASFLDAKTKPIDNIISKREKQIELLEEMKSAIISHAVTKGLNSDAKMKNSGIEWIGEIPEEWSIFRLQDLGYYRKGPFGSSIKLSLFVPKGADTIKVYEQQNAIKKDWTLGDYYITNDYFQSAMQGFEVLPGDIIVSCAGTIGETYLMPNDIEKGIINQALMRMRIKKKDLDVNYFLNIFDIILKNEAKVSSNGSAIKNIPPFEVFKKIRLPLPSLKEQRAISSYLDTETSKFDVRIAKRRKQIELLQEYKQALITDAVTGKIDVRGFNS